MAGFRGFGFNGCTCCGGGGGVCTVWICATYCNGDPYPDVTITLYASNNTTVLGSGTTGVDGCVHVGVSSTDFGTRVSVSPADDCGGSYPPSETTDGVAFGRTLACGLTDPLHLSVPARAGSCCGVGRMVVPTAVVLTNSVGSVTLNYCQDPLDPIGSIGWYGCQIGSAPGVLPVVVSEGGSCSYGCPTTSPAAFSHFLTCGYVGNDEAGNPQYGFTLSSSWRVSSTNGPSLYDCGPHCGIAGTTATGVSGLDSHCGCQYTGGPDCPFLPGGGQEGAGGSVVVDFNCGTSGASISMSAGGSVCPAIGNPLGGATISW